MAKKIGAMGGSAAGPQATFWAGLSSAKNKPFGKGSSSPPFL